MLRIVFAAAGVFVMGAGVAGIAVGEIGFVMAGIGLIVAGAAGLLFAIAENGTASAPAAADVTYLFLGDE